MTWIISPLIIQWLDKPIYSNHIDVLNVLIVMSLVYAIGILPHYSLYAMNGDKWIIAVHISSLFCFVVMILFVQFSTGMMTLANALLVTFLWQGLVKCVGYEITRKRSTILQD